MLFRGHGDSRYLLQSTLERRGRASVTVDDYYRTIAVGVKPQLESFTGQRFDATPYPVLRRLLREYDKFSLPLTGGKFPAAAYMIHTRHHGFPSPLMDWTRSAYIVENLKWRHDGIAYTDVYLERDLERCALQDELVGVLGRRQAALKHREGG